MSAGRVTAGAVLFAAALLGAPPAHAAAWCVTVTVSGVTGTITTGPICGGDTPLPGTYHEFDTGGGLVTITVEYIGP